MNISVIIPIYNVEAYIQECLDSVIAQTMSDGVECILVDDCGTDNSMNIALSVISDFKGPIIFRVIHHEHNKGLSAARNTGIREAKGEYIFFIDSDDYITPDCLESLWSLVEKYPNVDLVCGGYIGEKWCNFNVLDKRIKEYVDNKKWILRNSLGSKLFPVVAWNKLYRKELVTENQLYFKEGFIYEDTNYLIKLPYFVNDIAFLKRNTYYYRANYRGISYSSNKQLQLASRLTNLTDLLLYLKPDPTFYPRLRIICSIIQEIRSTYDTYPKEMIDSPNKASIFKLADIFGKVLQFPMKSVKGFYYRLSYYYHAYQIKRAWR